MILSHCTSPRYSPPRSSYVDYLARIARHIQLYYSAAALQCDPTSSSAEGKSIAQLHAELESLLQTLPPGDYTSDPVVARLALALRLLHLSDLRALQTDLTALAALGQEYTADPRTNSTLGRVGR